VAATLVCFCLLACPGHNYLINGRFSELDGKLPRAWILRQGEFAYDAQQGVAVLTSPPRISLLDPPGHSGVRLHQEVELPPGHYLLRAVARANTIEAILMASSLDYRGEADRSQKLSGPFGTPIGVSREFRTVELPFFVEDGGAAKKVMVGIQHQYGIRFDFKIEIKELSLVRLGDTELKAGWATHLPVRPWHGLDTLREAVHWDRPGRVIFTDTCTGAEVWLMTQGERSHLRAQGVNNFSPDGKYLYVNMPGVILRTDGSQRYAGFKREHNKPEPWLAPWMERRLPAGSNPSDWVEAAIPTEERVPLRNLVTGQELAIDLPKRPGWKLHLLPRKIWGQNLREMTHQTAVWLSEDEWRIGLSDVDGSGFREFRVKSISADPAKDVFLWKPFWTRGLDGAWYVAYILNWVPIMGSNPPTSENTVNPGQVWALPIDPADRRGPLRAVDGHQYPGMSVMPYVLEDGTVIHWWTATHRAMNAQAGYRIRGTGYSTLALETIDTGQVRHHIGSYPCLDHIDWNHPDFIFPESMLDPYVLLMIDVRRRAMWPVTVLHFHDYGAYTAFGAGFLAQNPSPDATKVAYVSSMLCKTKVPPGVRPKAAVDVYVAVIRYPDPPERVRREGNRLAWDKPHYHKEIRGFNVYRAGRSGIDYVRLNKEPIEGVSYSLSATETPAFYVLTSVEHSGLESRRFSNEVAVGGTRTPIRWFYEAELAELVQPMVPVFDPQNAGNAYAVAVPDPALLYRKRLDEGLQGTGTFKVETPGRDAYRLMGRVRALKEDKRGHFELKLNGVPAGRLTVEGSAWHWVGLDRGSVELPEGPAEIAFGTSAVGIALDTLLLTNDPSFQPVGQGNVPTRSPLQPQAVRIEPTPDERIVAGISTPHLVLTWKPSSAPQGVRYYNIHRGERPDFEATQATLLGSVSGPPFVDCGLSPQPYYYRVVAWDNWGHASPPSAAVAGSVSPSSPSSK